jgi:hypothetical protein
MRISRKAMVAAADTLTARGLMGRRPHRCFPGALTRITALVSALLLGVLALSASPAGAVSARPAWKVLAAIGPTNIPPEQSAVQRVTVEAEGGGFSLSATIATGQGTLGFAEGIAETTEGSNQAHMWLPLEGTFQAGQQVSDSDFPMGTTVLGVSGPETEPTLELSSSATATDTFSYIQAASKEITGVTTSSGKFSVGSSITGAGVPSGTIISSVEGSKLTLSNYLTGGGHVALASSATTALIAYDATAQTVQTALEAIMGSGSVDVSGGPGGDGEHPYFIDFGGTTGRGPFADQDVGELQANSEALLGEHAYAHVFTVVPGGPGTGEFAVFPFNAGGEPSGSEVTVDIGPLPAGIVTSGPAQGEGWTCGGASGQSSLSCHTTEVTGALQLSHPIQVPVSVTRSAATTASVPVTVSGGGGGEAEYHAAVSVSANDAQAGFQALLAGAFEADGTPSTQAGGHPFSDLNLFLLNSVRSASGQIVPAGDAENIVANLPSGFVGDPLATGRCPQSETYGCGEAAVVGHLTPLISEFGVMATSFYTRIFDDVPGRGAAAEFTSLLGIPLQSLTGGLRSESDFGVQVTAPHIPTIDKVFGGLTAFEGEPVGSPGVAWLRNPTDCGEEAREAPVEAMEGATWQEPDVWSRTAEDLAPVTGCDKLRFEPEFGFQPTSTQGSSGVGATAHLHIDQKDIAKPGTLATPDVKESVVALPQGLDINPAQANGLEACSEAQVGYVGAGPLPNPTRFNNTPVSCPNGSKLGTVEATSPELEEPLKGTIYLAAQEENPFHSLIAVYLVFESERSGITLKLPGKVEADAKTGQLTATFDYLPQQPIEDLTLNFRGGGPRSEFATPEVCGTYSTTGTWTPWSAPESGPPAQTSSSFSVSSGCSSSAATRPFQPSFEAGTTNPVAGSYSPLVIKVNRNDGEQELTSLDFTLPEGLLGDLGSVPYCSDAAIEAARSVSGKAEQANPSCPAASQIGTVDTAAGVGSEPIHVGGFVYLAGPYEGAPLSAVVITPAVAGPFDLGDVVIRTPLSVNAATAQVTAKSDPIPTILKGIPLKLRSVAITLNRPNFTLNPTSCEAMSVTASLASSNGATASPANRFQVGGCAGLPFKPTLSASTQAKASKANGASLALKIAAKPGEANIHKVDLQLPVKLPSRLSTLQKACTEAQFNADPGGCPAESIIGSATARTPILQVPLTGPAYLVSHGGAAFPDIEYVLQADERGGDIEIVLDGHTQITKGITYSHFETVPDAPISSFETVLPEGPHSILTAYLPAGDNYDLCGQSLQMPTTLTGQNGAVLKQTTPLAVTGCAPSIKVTKHTVKGTSATLVVSVPSAGKLTASGSGMTALAKTVSAAKSVTLKVKLSKKEQAFLAVHRQRKLKLRVKLQFTPKKGAKLSTAVTVLIG